LYISAAFDVLFSNFAPIVLLVAAVRVAAGYLIANEKVIGYQLGVGVAAASIVLGLGGVLAIGILSLLFEVVLLVLLLHEQSREHQRIWFS
jgi:hypothetical protein